MHYEYFLSVVLWLLFSAVAFTTKLDEKHPKYLRCAVKLIIVIFGLFAFMMAVINMFGAFNIIPTIE